MSEQNNKSDATQQKGKLSRRDFLLLGGTALGTVALRQAAKSPKTTRGAEDHPEGGHLWGMVIDIDLCIGCNYCTYACQAVNNLSDDMKYNIVSVETTEIGDEFFLSRPCMQCAHPPCVHVCPVEATYIRPDGIVAMDYDLCIGCRYCMIACPYDVRVFNWYEHTEDSPRVPEFGTPELPPRPRGVMEKCHFCSHRIDFGLERGLVPGVDAAATPACIVACPTGSRVFGDLNDPNSPANQKLAVSDNPIRLRNDLSTEPRVLYIPPRIKEG
ncbi:MAG: 4Fe-4S dicluster domain-containing protein [Anaerolineales bacterium]|nr:4Fe-4S dicluster domain-containing protein [Anaerolineales bacterium]